jgi:hypothetical protein
LSTIPFLPPGNKFMSTQSIGTPTIPDSVALLQPIWEPCSHSCLWHHAVHPQWANQWRYQFWNCSP